MGLKLFDPATEPEVYNVVWCRWPQREDKLAPGSWVRCVLVIDVRRMIDTRSEQEYSLLTVAYGTGKENVKTSDLANNLIIERNEFRDLGLHKPTVFKLDLRNRKRLPWCPEYFVAKEYFVSENIVAGSLNLAQRDRFHACLRARNFTFPLP